MKLTNDVEINSKKFANAVTRLETARLAYEEAKKDETVARHRATDTLNKLNDAQKAFSRILEEFKKLYPDEWGK